MTIQSCILITSLTWCSAMYGQPGNITRRMSKVVKRAGLPNMARALTPHAEVTGSEALIEISRFTNLDVAPDPGSAVAQETATATFFRYTGDATPPAPVTPAPVPPFDGMTVEQTTIGSCTAIKITGSSPDVEPPLPAPGEGQLVPLDAGTVLAITGDSGSRPILKSDTGSYAALLGGDVQDDGQVRPSFLTAGSYTLDNGAGGQDVGAFRIAFPIPQQLIWTNGSSVRTIDRTSDLSLTWTGGDPLGTVQIAGFSLKTVPQPLLASFTCTAKASAGAFTVPAGILSFMPPTSAGQTPLDFGISTLIMGALVEPVAFTAPGLDSGLLTIDTEVTKSVVFK